MNCSGAGSDVVEKAIMHQIYSHFAVLTKAAGVTKIDDGGLEMTLPPGAEEEAARLWGNVQISVSFYFF